MHNRHFLLQQFHSHQINLLDSMLHSHHIIYFMHKLNCSSDCAHKIFSWISEQQLTSVYKNRVTFVQFHTSFKLNCDKKKFKFKWWKLNLIWGQIVCCFDTLRIQTKNQIFPTVNSYPVRKLIGNKLFKQNAITA